MAGFNYADCRGIYIPASLEYINPSAFWRCYYVEEFIVSPENMYYYTIDGVWMLQEWNGTPLAPGTLLYIALDRKEHRFEMWDNLNSMYMVETTGGFAIKVDYSNRYILSGWYDYGAGDWSSEYFVSMDAEGDYMFWVRMADDNLNGEDSSDKMVFKKIDNIPAF